MERLEICSFRDITLEDKNLIGNYLEHDSSISCEKNFSNLFCWQSYRVQWRLWHERLLLYSIAENEMLFPCGAYFTPAELATLSDEFIAGGGNGSFYDVPEQYIEKYPEIGDCFTVEHNDDFDDYVYLTASLFRLSGEKLRKKRNLVRQFERTYPAFRVSEITPENTSECLNFALAVNGNDTTTPQIVEAEKIALTRAFVHFAALDLKGLLLWTEEKPAGISVFSRQNRITWSVHFEKFDHGIKGAGQMINRETAKFLLGCSQYLNREQDLGIPGLRQAKRSYEPVFMYRRYRLRRRAD